MRYLRFILPLLLCLLCVETRAQFKEEAFQQQVAVLARVFLVFL